MLRTTAFRVLSLVLRKVGLSSDVLAAKIPVSVKAIIVLDSRVVLIRNDRNEWELPGGKLKRGEDPALCIVREIREELGIDVIPIRLINAWIYNITSRISVLVLTYYCAPASGDVVIRSPEGWDIGLFAESELASLSLPKEYVGSIAQALARLRAVEKSIG